MSVPPQETVGVLMRRPLSSRPTRPRVEGRPTTDDPFCSHYHSQTPLLVRVVSGSWLAGAGGGGRPVSASSVAALRPGRGAPLPVAEARERPVRRRVGLVWGLLVSYVLGFTGPRIQFPGASAMALPQGALLVGP